jgi:hypothetical protein
MRNRFVKGVLVAALLGLGATGCSGDSGDSGDELRAQTEQHYALWKEAPTLNYELHVNFPCFCSPANLKVVVENGVVIEAVDVNTGADSLRMSIDFLYEEMLRALDGNWDHQEAEFNAQQRIPVSFSVSKDDVADGGWAFRVTCFATDGQGCSP